jgi:SAM-dependent methyltransferase
MTTNPPADVPVEAAACVCCGRAEGFVPEAVVRDYEYLTTEQAFTVVRCGACGHLFLNPRPAIEAAERLYPDAYYTRTDEHRGGLLGTLKDRVVLARLRGLLEGLPCDAAVLDVGCGDGALLLALRRLRPRLQLAGLDLSFTAGQRERLGAAGVALIEGPIERAAIGEDRFDLVLMNQIIEHLWDVGGALAAVHRSLRPGGRVSIATPNPRGYDRAWYRAGTWGGYYAPRHLNLFTPAALGGLLRARGFEVVSSRSLVAPLVWVRNVQFSLTARGSRMSRLFTDRNLLALAVFTVMDAAMMRLGRETSNQQCVARKTGER